VLLRFLPKADAAGVDLGGEGLDETVTVLADAALVEGILGNLLDNALRYGHTEHSQVTVSVTSMGASTVLSVTDNGPGMTALQAEQLRGRWVRGSADHSASAQGGAGLGLAIVSRYAELLGARLTLAPVGEAPGLRASITFTTVAG
jgi:two-component system sensor histidine kinase TctE